MTTTTGHANAGVTALISPAATPHHLRDMAATLEDHARHMEEREPTDAEAFLARMAAAAEAGERVTAADVARLKRLADWADAAPAPGWDGTLDRGETARAISAARERLAHG
jgi:hypothetical protein